MTDYAFKLMKEDFMREYEPHLCEESLGDISSAMTLKDFVSVLHKYMTFVNLKPFPSSEWVRKWFVGNVEELNKYGVYLDQSCTLYNPASDIICFGRCCLSMHFTQSRVWNILCYGYSSVLLYTHTICNVNVRTKDKSIATEVQKHKGSIVKIRKA